jgi:hypothetical protein
MFVKLRSYNAKLGIDMLTVMPVSKASGLPQNFSCPENMHWHTSSRWQVLESFS